MHLHAKYRIPLFKSESWMQLVRQRSGELPMLYATAVQRWQSIRTMQALLSMHHSCGGLPQLRDPKAKPSPSTEGEGLALGSLK